MHDDTDGTDTSEQETDSVIDDANLGDDIGTTIGEGHDSLENSVQ